MPLGPGTRAAAAALLILGAMPRLLGEEAAPASFDFVVYGGTAGGVIAAVAAAREGLRVALLEPGTHLGGMVAGGLGYTDHANTEVIGGYSLEFFQRVGSHYHEPKTWYFEPHVAEQVFGELIREAGVHVFFHHRLREKTGVVKHGTEIDRIVMENGATFHSRLFADAGYEGDLMAQSGISYTWGREAVTEYGESLAGVRERTPMHQFLVRVNPFDARGRLLPEVAPWPRGEIGAADRKVQAYTFRVCTTDRADNRLPFPKPENYNVNRYELLRRMLVEIDKRKTVAALGRQRWELDPLYHLDEPWSISDVLLPRAITHGKYDTNNNGAFSTDYIGGNYDYPDGDYQTRARIWQQHADYVKGFLYFVTTDPRVPKGLRDAMATWGLCKDEFVDNDHWPFQLYVREARRMRGDFVFSQKDIQTDRTKPDVIGMGSYHSDSHNVQRVATADGVENEGDMQVPVRPYQIPYRLIVPKRTEATNLLVPVAFSATHVAYSTLRMEPQYMIIGHAAGVAAKLALDARQPVQDVDTSALAAKLRAQRAVLQWPREAGQ